MKKSEYFDHLWFGIRVGLLLIVGGLIVIIHSIIPFVFKKAVIEVIDTVKQCVDYDKIKESLWT